MEAATQAEPATQAEAATQAEVDAKRLSASSEPATEEAESAVPRLLRPDRVVLGGGNAARSDGGLVGEGMVREVAVEVEGHAGFAQFLLQQIDGGDGEELVLRGPMRLQRHPD